MIMFYAKKEIMKTGPRYGQDVPPYQNQSFYVMAFKIIARTDRDTQTV